MTVWLGGGRSVRIGDLIEVKILSVRGRQITLGVVAPAGTAVCRQENGRDGVAATQGCLELTHDRGEQE